MLVRFSGHLHNDGQKISAYQQELESQSGPATFNAIDGLLDELLEWSGA
ncbi:MAG: hypothetical protein AAB150_12255 [Pseudomonadota bacterium]